MRTLSATWLILCLVNLSQLGHSADKTPDDLFPAGLVNMTGAAPSVMVLFYAELSGMKLVTSSHVEKLTAKVVLQPNVELKRSEVLRLFEKALLEQAGVVLTKLNDTQVSVTYNDALPITAVTNATPAPRMLQPPHFLLGPDGKPLQPPRPPSPTNPTQK